ncbi:MAG: CCA tRNA nucleotidyltransferase [Synechococcus sp.]|nr:CCA tRNA nucleotidyltransferase [Synechococcus sp.]
MPQGSRPGAILPAQTATAGAVAAEAAAAEAAAQLRLRLAPERWPLPIEALPADAVLVGGAVRDGLLDRLPECPDLDLVVSEDAIALARRLARRLGGSCVVLDPERSIARLVLRGWTVDLARCCGSDLTSDLRRRDYTVNAIALPLRAGAPLVDPTGGLADLERRELVAVSEANLLEDPLRLLRGLRLAAELEFRLSPTTASWLERHRHQLGSVAGERVLGELEKLAAAPAGERGLAEVIRLELLRPWGGEPAAAGPLLALDRAAAPCRGFSAAEAAWALPLARLARLLAPEVVERLHGSRRLQQQCARLRRWLQRLESAGSLEALGEEARLQLQQELEPILPALLLCLPAAAAREPLRRWRDPADPLVHPRPPLDGRRLQQALGIPAGPRLGELLAHLTRERAYGRLPEAGEGSTAEEEVLERARQWWEART